MQTHVASSQWCVKQRVSHGEAKTTLQYYPMLIGERFTSKSFIQSGDIQTNSSKDPSVNEGQFALL